MITDSVELWRKLTTVADFKDVAYDEELKNAIASDLSINAEIIEEELRNKQISTGQLLTSVLNALMPFSQMMGELLNTYEKAGAKSNNNNIEIVFDFDTASTRYSLDSFRKKVSMINERMRVKTRLLNPWEFINHLKKYENAPTPFQRGEKVQYPPEIRKWFWEYQHDRLPEHLPSFPITHNMKLDYELNKVVDIVEDALQQYREEYIESKGLRESIRSACEKYNTDFWWAETDYWLGQFVKVYYEMVTYYQAYRTKNLTAIEVYLKKILNDPNVVTVVTERDQYAAITDILDMPFWKYRYELYSAWVFTCIVDSVSALGIKYNVVDGILQFKFSGALLATINTPYVVFEIWAEKRFQADRLTGEGRKKHIQPDYSIIQKENGTDITSILIECKQYKKPNYKNFADAINDYSRAFPEAKVYLVNYGRITKSLVMRIGTDVKRRYNAYSRVRPVTSERTCFIWNLRDYIEGMWAENQFRHDRELIVWEKKPNQIKIELSWNCSPSDLDLAVTIKMPSIDEDYCVNWCEMGSEKEYPYTRLNCDTRKEPGRETILIKKMISGYYDIFIRNYSGEKMIDGNIVVSLFAGKRTIRVFKSGIWKQGCSWHIGIINTIGFVKLDEWMDEPH